MIVVLALLGCGIATDLALYQLRVADRVWDPVFDGQSERVLDSNVSLAIRRIVHVPDAALGALAYATEIVLCVASASRRRWTKILFAANSFALLLAGIALVLLQAFLVHAWCLLCLASAGISCLIAIMSLGGLQRN